MEATKTRVLPIGGTSSAVFEAALNKRYLFFAVVLSGFVALAWWLLTALVTLRPLPSAAGLGRCLVWLISVFLLAVCLFGCAIARVQHTAPRSALRLPPPLLRLAGTYAANVLSGGITGLLLWCSIQTSQLGPVGAVDAALVLASGCACGTLFSMRLCLTRLHCDVRSEVYAQQGLLRAAQAHLSRSLRKGCALAVATAALYLVAHVLLGLSLRPCALWLAELMQSISAVELQTDTTALGRLRAVVLLFFSTLFTHTVQAGSDEILQRLLREPYSFDRLCETARTQPSKLTVSALLQQPQQPPPSTPAALLLDALRIGREHVYAALQQQQQQGKKRPGSRSTAVVLGGGYSSSSSTGMIRWRAELELQHRAVAVAAAAAAAAAVSSNDFSSSSSASSSSVVVVDSSEELPLWAIIARSQGLQVSIQVYICSGYSYWRSRPFLSLIRFAEYCRT
jgi:hypothetical protein